MIPFYGSILIAHLPLKMYNPGFLTHEEIEAQMELTNILYNGTGPEPAYQTSSIEKQKLYHEAIGEEAQRKTALAWIDVMTNCEFQTRLVKGTLPDFVREELIPAKHDDIPRLIRQTNHPCGFLTDEILRAGFLTQGYICREQLRYYSIDEFKEGYYEN